MLIRTFGGLAVEAEDGDGPAPSIGPRRLALLALVAAAGPRAITRERILGVLWPDADEEQARHTLSQTLYLLRRETGREWIVGAASLRLDPTVKSDVGDFREALQADDLARAGLCYTGPFLEGFYLAGAPEFEQWVEETRAQLQLAARKALEILARRSAERGAHAEALDWLRRLGEIDPFSATCAIGQMRALIALGDHSAALHFGQRYESRVRRELEAAPDPGVVALMASLQGVPEAAAPEAPVAIPGIRRIGRSAPAGARTARGTRRARVWLSAALAGSAVMVAGMAWSMGASRADAPAPPLLAIGLISSRDTAVPGPVLRDMLATNLARIGELQVLANSRLVELLPAQSATPAAIVSAARRAGARELVEGEVGSTADGLLLSLRRVALESGVVHRGYSVRARDAYALIDSATAAIARDLRVVPPATAVATVRTRSTVAYAMYEEGLRAFYAANVPAALRLMESALERDSTFAMAAYFAWLSAHLMNRYEAADSLLLIAQRLSRRAVDRERLIIEANITRRGAPISEYLPIARRLAARYPSDPDGQIALGNALQYAGNWRESVAAFNRAIAIDSAAGVATGSTYCRVCDAIGGLVRTYLWWDSAAAAERASRRLIRFRPGGGYGYGPVVEPLLRQGRRADAEAAIAELARRDGTANFAPALDRDLIRSGRLDELETRLLSLLVSAQPEPFGETPWLYLILLRNQGRLREAELIASGGIAPGLGRPLRTDRDILSLGAIALERGQARQSARYFLTNMPRAREYRLGDGWLARDLAWRMTLAATALAAAGDTAQVRALADSVERTGARSGFGRDPVLHLFLRGLLLQRANRHAEAVTMFRRSLFSTTDGYTRVNLELARSLMRLGRHAEAIAVLQPALRGGVDGGNTYVTHTELHYLIARAFEAAGQRDSARTHYAAVERAWRRADPPFAERYREAKAKSLAGN